MSEEKEVKEKEKDMNIKIEHGTAEGKDTQKERGESGVKGGEAPSTIEEYKRVLEAKEREVAELKDKLLRLGAEFENFKKRMEREKEEYMKYALEAFAKELLPFLDNLERAIQTAKENPDPSKIIEGLELTLSGYFNTLEKFGLKQFVAEGKRFDPNFHEALGVEEHDGVEENTVIKELLKGYTLHERVIRPALVVVSKKAQKESGQSESDA